MFWTKKQNNPVSRTISAPEQKGFSSLFGGNQSSKVDYWENKEVKRVCLVYKQLDLNHSFPSVSSQVSFTEYRDPYVCSPGFTGCYMAVFHFNKEPKETDPIDFEGGDNHLFRIGVPYVAHVFSSGPKSGGLDTKYRFGELESIGLITIEALFKPYDGEKDRDNKFNFTMLHNAKHPLPGLQGFTDTIGMITKDKNGKWIAMSSFQYYYNYVLQNREGSGRIDEEQELYRYYNPQDLILETYFQKGRLGVIPNEDIDFVHKPYYNQGIMTYSQEHGL